MKEINIRRSVRKFKDKKVEEEKIIKVLRAAMQAKLCKKSTTLGIYSYWR